MAPWLVSILIFGFAASASPPFVALRVIATANTASNRFIAIFPFPPVERKGRVRNARGPFDLADPQ